MPRSIEPFCDVHVPEAAELAARRIAALRDEEPLLPAAWADAAAIVPLLTRIVDAGPAVVAIEDGRVIGHLAGWLGAGRGLRWAFSPEWAGSAGGRDPRRTLESMYTALSAIWVDAGIDQHLLSVPASEASTSRTLTDLGFGVVTVDAIRGIEALDAGGGVDPATASIRCRRGGPADASLIAELERGLRAHLARAPVFFVLGPERDLDEHRARLDDEVTATFIAEDGSGPLAYLRIGPASDDAATVIRDAHTASITGAFTVADRRGVGVATLLLDAALAWARAGGATRCAVDFESMNVEARRFWLRWFRPVVLTMGRRLDPRPSG